MDKKQNYHTRQGSNKVLISEPRKSSDLFTSKPLPRNGKRRENPNKNENNQRNFNSGPKIRTNVDKRPKPRCNGTLSSIAAVPSELSSTSSGLAVANATKPNSGRNDYEVELNSIYTPGSKKQNLNHLLNFHYNSRDDGASASGGLNVFGRNGNRGYVKKHRYNKEAFLQANFQFVVKVVAEPFIDASNPDTLVEWSLIEQINIQTTEEPQCPICLYRPIAAKLTRCGHVYCWPCILHYLALSDKTWRKCPICYEAIHLADLKSTSIIQQVDMKVGDFVTLQLMRRKKGSMLVEKFSIDGDEFALPADQDSQLSDSIDMKLFSKILLADSREILMLLEKERQELVHGDDLDCPESVFIQQALGLLRERKMLIAKELNIQYEDLDDIINLVEVKEPSQEVEKVNTIEYELVSNDNSSAENVIVPMNTAKSSTIQKDKFYYFYQSVDGQNIFLHPLNVKMLQAMYGSLDNSPPTISSKIIQKENQSINEEYRKKFTCLGHLPLTCQFEIVEVQLNPPIVSNEVLRMFKDDIMMRQKTRQYRAKEEKKREKEINEINERQMGKLIARSANIDIKSSHQFPTCGFEESLTGNFLIDSANSTYASEFSDSPPIQSAFKNSFASFANILSSPKKELWPSLESKTDDTFKSTELSWGKGISRKTPSIVNSKVEEPSKSYAEFEDYGDVAVMSSNNLSDVLAEAFENKKKSNIEKSDACVGAERSGALKKNKKTKKTLLFSSGMNCGRN